MEYSRCLPFLLLWFTIPSPIYAHKANVNISSVVDPILDALLNPPRVKCGSVSCSFPCPGAAPPRMCPEPPPDCATGCACVVDCRRKAVVCFETSNCAERRKLFRRTKKPKS